MALEHVVTILAFFFLSWSYGFSLLDMFNAREKHPLNQLIAELGVGLAVFSFLGVLFGLLHVPLHVNVYLILAAAYPAYALFKTTKQPRKKRTSLRKTLVNKESVICGILFVVLLIFFSIFHNGAFSYPYLENDDPWGHAIGSLYITTEQTYSVDPGYRASFGSFAPYLEPYPPTYDILMGVLRQLNRTLSWTLKFFNVLMITMGLAFTFLFFRKYTRSDEKALFATVILAILPSYMSHFIWSQTLAMVLAPIAWYTLLMALDDKRWRVPAVVTIASSMVTQPVVSFFTGVVIILIFILYTIREWKRLKRAKEVFLLGLSGFALSFAYWGAQIIKWSVRGISEQKGGEITGGWYQPYTLQKYALKDIIFAPYSSRIDQATGFGLVVSLLLLAGIVLLFLFWKKTLNPKKEWRYAHTLIWFLLLAYLVFAPSIGLFGWGSSRLWAQLAIPLAVIATEGAFIIVTSITKENRLRWVLLGTLLLLAGFTSAPAKVAVQTAQWPPGVQWFAPQVEIPAYTEMRRLLEPGSRVYPLCGDSARVIGFDMVAEPWNTDQAYFRRHLGNATANETIRFLRRHNFRYVTLDASCIRQLGRNKTVEYAQALSQTHQLRQILSKDGFLLAEVV